MMKRIIVPMLFAVAFLAFPGTGANAQSSAGLVGTIRLEQLFDLPDWFGADFVRYMPDRQYVSKLPEYLEDIEIVCFLGTWCSDSRVQVPRLIKVLQQANIDPARLELVGLDRNKQSPEGREIDFGIEKVPTVILLHKGQEVGRIVEEPIGTMEKDMIGLISKAFPEKYPMYDPNPSAALDDSVPPEQVGEEHDPALDHDPEAERDDAHSHPDGSDDGSDHSSDGTYDSQRAVPRP